MSEEAPETPTLEERLEHVISEHKLAIDRQTALKTEHDRLDDVRLRLEGQAALLQELIQENAPDFITEPDEPKPEAKKKTPRKK